jgi:hypothetical protein
MGTWARNSTWKYIKIGKEADDILVEPPSGKKTIDSTAEVDVSAYATAQVVDANLTAENIKKDVEVLGITGSYEGGGGSSDFTTAEVTVVYTVNDDYSFPLVYAADENELGEGSPKMIYNMAFLPAPDPPGYPVTLTFNAVLYDGIQCFSYDESLSASVSGDITENDGFYTITGAGTITLHD